MIRTTVIFLWFLVNIVFKIKSKYSFLLGIVALLLSATFSFARPGFSLRLITYAFSFYFVGALMYLFELRNEKK